MKNLYDLIEDILFCTIDEANDILREHNYFCVGEADGLIHIYESIGNNKMCTITTDGRIMLYNE